MKTKLSKLIIGENKSSIDTEFKNYIDMMSNIIPNLKNLDSKVPLKEFGIKSFMLNINGTNISSMASTPQICNTVNYNNNYPDLLILFYGEALITC
jgi:hypothetical protein